MSATRQEAFEVVGVLDSADVLSDAWPTPIHCSLCGQVVPIDERQIIHLATGRRWHGNCWPGSLAAADRMDLPL